jgi:fatty-acyl-CoA synthase
MAMMDVQLNSWLLFEHAARHHAEVEVVTQLPGQRHRYTYGEFSARAQRLMHALDRLGLEPGDRVASLAWNTYRHLELYFAVPCTRRILHTLNLRLSPEDLSFIVSDADDRAIFVDADLLPLLERLKPALEHVKHIVVLAGEVPATSLPNVISYEDLIAGQPADYPRQDIQETLPLGICYTSGTTGRPKGAVYTHRSTFLHSQAVTSAAGLGVGPQDCVFPIVPMFHANAWGIPFAATAVGAKQVLFAGALDAAAVVRLIHQEGVTISSGVPTIWMSVADEFARQGTPPRLRYLTSGGAQPPRQLMHRYLTDFKITILQGWGMTETSPVAAIAWPKHHMADWAPERILEAVRMQAGLPLPGVDVRIVGEDRKEVPADGKTLGQLLVRGPWIVDSYWKGVGAEQFTDDGWFRTGDVATCSPDGYIVIADRTKDLVKSGGEWISSVDMEGAIMAMPEVLEATVIAVPDPKWQERPLVVVVIRPGASVTIEAVRAHLAQSGWAGWQLPERIEVVDEIPKTSVGKFDKKALRARFPGD